jgi:Viral BACON domain
MRVRNCVKGAGVGLLLASTLWLANCDSTRAPANPTPALTTGAPSRLALSGGSDGVVTVSWQCMIATVTGAWQAAECPTLNTSTVRLTTGSAITAPGNPTNLSAAVSGSRVTLTWTGPVGGDAPASYIVEAGSAAGRVDLANFDTGTSATSLIANGVAAGTYFVRVRARNSAGTSGLSNEIVLTVTGSGTCTPGAPASLTASASGSTVNLSWAGPGGSCAPTAYTIEAGSAPGLSNLANFSTGTTATSFTAGGVGAGTYYVRVRANNGPNVSTPSNEATLVVAGSGCTSAPPAPGGLTGSVNGTNVSLAWGSVAGATSYVLEAGSGPGQSNLFIGDQGAATSLSATAAAGTYYVRVKAKNACGTSAGSNEVVLNVQTACGYTVSPTSTTIGSASGSLTITVTTTGGCPWTAVSNASFITIKSGGSGTGNGAVTLDVTANTGSSSRSGTVTIAGQTVTITQSGTSSCTFSLSITSATLPAVGGTQTIGVTASSPSCTWTAQSNASFVSITNANFGTGNGNVVLSIKANAGAQRTGTVTLADQTLTITENEPFSTPASPSSGCPNQSTAAPTGATLQVINLLDVPITVFRPTQQGNQDQSVVQPGFGVEKSTNISVVWQVSTQTEPCRASYTVQSQSVSAIVRP